MILLSSVQYWSAFLGDRNTAPTVTKAGRKTVDPSSLTRVPVSLSTRRMELERAGPERVRPPSGSFSNFELGAGVSRQALIWRSESVTQIRVPLTPLR